MNEYCTWSEDEDGLWWTTCKKIHEFFDGTPTENSYKFCSYCGKEIVEFKYKRDEAETGPEEGVMAMTELMEALEETSEALEFALSRLGCCGHGDGGDHKADVDDYGGLALCVRNKDLLKKIRSNNIPDATEAKAEAYDRLMSGGKKALKEWANLLGKPVAVDVRGNLLWFPKRPEIGLTTWIWYDEQFGCFGECLQKDFFDYTEDWKESLTLPDGWEE